MGDTSKLCECGHEQAKHEGLERLCMAKEQDGWTCVCHVFRLPIYDLSEAPPLISTFAPMVGITGRVIDPAGVDHPAHYNQSPSGVECIDVIEHMPHNIGAAIKYLWRVGLKGDATDAIRDVRKAAWYAEREAKRLEKLRGAK